MFLTLLFLLTGKKTAFFLLNEAAQAVLNSAFTSTGQAMNRLVGICADLKDVRISFFQQTLDRLCLKVMAAAVRGSDNWHPELTEFLLTKLCANGKRTKADAIAFIQNFLTNETDPKAEWGIITIPDSIGKSGVIVLNQAFADNIMRSIRVRTLVGVAMVMSAPLVAGKDSYRIVTGFGFRDPMADRMGRNIASVLDDEAGGGMSILDLQDAETPRSCRASPVLRENIIWRLCDATTRSAR